MQLPVFFFSLNAIKLNNKRTTIVAVPFSNLQRCRRWRQTSWSWENRNNTCWLIFAPNNSAGGKRNTSQFTVRFHRLCFLRPHLYDAFLFCLSEENQWYGADREDSGQTGICFVETLTRVNDRERERLYYSHFFICCLNNREFRLKSDKCFLFKWPFLDRGCF